MTTRLAINGFGRIGRNVLRALYEGSHNDLEVVAINDLAPLETNAHLFKYDSVHGIFKGDVKADGDTLHVNGGKVQITSEKDPANLPWGDLGVDIVLECTGVFTEREAAAAHLKAGAKKVLISAPGKNVDMTVVYGVNHQELTHNHTVVSNASCTTNCLAPMAKVLNDHFGIKHGLMTTIHAYTNDQRTLDLAHKDLHRARAAGLNMIPTSTGAAKAVGLVLPDLDGKLDGFAMRVPTPNVSVVDLTFVPEKSADVDTINQAMAEAASDGLKGVLAYNEAPLVSVDFNHNPASSVFDATQTRIVDNGELIKVLSWYDNEWGFSNRMLDTSRHLATL